MQKMQKKGETRGIPSTEKPWLKYITPNGTGENPPIQTIYRSLVDNIKDNNITAINYMGNTISYGALVENIHRAAQAFVALGVRAGDIVTIISSNTPETVYCFYALNYIGAVPNMEYATVSENGAIRSITACKSKVVLVLDALLSGIAGITNILEVEYVISLPVADSLPLIKRIAYNLSGNHKPTVFPKELSYKQFLEKGHGVDAKEEPLHDGELAVIVHSGGTTGTPKGVMLSNENIVSIGWVTQHNLEYASSHDSSMCFIPMFHAFGLVAGLVSMLSYGWEVILSPKFDEATLYSTFKKRKPNHIMTSGSHVNAMMQDQDIQNMDLSFLKTFAYGGSPISPALEEEMVDFLQSHNSNSRPNCGYGMSELASAACMERNSYYGKTGSTGVPLAGMNVKVLDVDTGEDVGYDKTGEICFSSPGLMLGYYNNPEETEKAFFYDADGVKWIHTGDVGYIDQDGFVFITGRIKRIYSTRGGPGGTMFKIFPDYVSNVISEVEGVDACAVACISHPSYVNVAVAFVVLKDGYSKKDVEDDILQHVDEVLPIHNHPQAIKFVKKLPLTKVGKPDWVKLEKEAAKLINI